MPFAAMRPRRAMRDITDEMEEAFATRERIRAHLRAALFARDFARAHRNAVVLSRFRAQAEHEARECFARAYGYLRAAKAIKRERNP